MTQESWCFEIFVDNSNQDSVSSQTLELDQYQTFENHIDNFASYHFSEIELKHRCDSNPQFGDTIPLFESMLTPVALPDLNHISEPTLISLIVNLELESPILQSHISLMGTKCEPQFFDLDPIFYPISTRKLLLDFSQISESVLIPVFFNL